jgi:D-threonate/D-erythronate kinase
VKILLIADDLTGALDSAAAFAQRGMSVICAIDSTDLHTAFAEGPDVVSVSTNSRESNESFAMSSLVKTAQSMANYPEWRTSILFKKIDSRLKGHVSLEINALRRIKPHVVICPAIPRLGRLVINGCVSGAGISQDLQIADVAGVSADEIINARTDADLDSAVAQSDLGSLFVGAAGLAEALARRITNNAPIRMAPRTQKPALIAIGSRDPVTIAQLAPFTTLAAPNGIVPANAQACDPLTVIQMTQGPEKIAGSQAGEQFAKSVSNWVKTHRPATLLVSGGESAAAVARNLGCKLLRVEGEVLPGLPVSTMMNSELQAKIITKSGGFGAQDTLTKIAENLDN